MKVKPLIETTFDEYEALVKTSLALTGSRDDHLILTLYENESPYDVDDLTIERAIDLLYFLITHNIHYNPSDLEETTEDADDIFAEAKHLVE